MWEAVAALLGSGGLAATGLAFLRWYLSRRDNQRVDRIPGVINRTHEVYGELQRVVAETRAQRAMIFKAEYDGKFAQLGGRMHSSIVYEWAVGLPARRDTWEGQQLDEADVKLLKLTARDDTIRFAAEGLPSGHLRDMLLADGVVECRMYQLLRRESGFFYLHLDFVDGSDLTPGERDVIRATRAEIKQLFRIDHQSRVK